jgi:hypothetical protein
VLLVIGADREPHGLDALGKRFGLEVEWIDGSTRMIDKAERRIRAGSVSGIIVLDGYMPHRHFVPLLAASRATGVPLAYGGRGGKGALGTAADALAPGLAARRVA